LHIINLQPATTIHAMLQVRHGSNTIYKQLYL
jgi:hypothetical protein